MSLRAGSAGLGIILVALLVTATPAAGARTDWMALRTMNIAHQGGEKEAPSSTMYALKRAMMVGSDMLEIDVHTSADGKLMVLHDATVDRTTDGSGLVSEMTAAEVQALDAAHTFIPGVGNRDGGDPDQYPFRGVRHRAKPPPPGFAPSDFRIPTLDEVFDEFPGVPINIEIKGDADLDFASFMRNAETLAAFVNGTGRVAGINVASFNDLALQRFHELAPQIDLAPGIAGVAAFKLANVPPQPEARMRVFQVPISFQGIPVTDRDFVERAHAGGRAVHVWTINEEDEMLHLLDLGVEGIMTATTARLERVLCREGVERPRRPRGFRGRHCNPRASIACEVAPVAARRTARGGRVRVRVRRGDEFEGRCAGRAGIRVQGIRGWTFRRFNFGERPPAEGGPAVRTVTIRPSRRARQRLRRGGARVGAIARPWGAYPNRARLPVR